MFHKLYLSYFAGCPSGVLPPAPNVKYLIKSQETTESWFEPYGSGPPCRGAGCWEDPAKKPSLSTDSLAHRRTHTWGPDVHVPVRVPQLIRLRRKTKAWLLIMERRQIRYKVQDKKFQSWSAKRQRFSALCFPFTLESAASSIFGDDCICKGIWILPLLSFCNLFRYCFPVYMESSEASEVFSKGVGRKEEIICECNKGRFRFVSHYTESHCSVQTYLFLCAESGVKNHCI